MGLVDRTNFTSIKNSLNSWIRNQHYKTGDKIAIRVDNTMSSFVAVQALKNAMGIENVMGIIILNDPYDTGDPGEYAEICDTLNIQHIVLNIGRMVEASKSQLKMAGIDGLAREKAERDIVNREVYNAMRIFADNCGYSLSSKDDYSVITMGKSTRGGDSCCDINPVGKLTNIEIQEICKIDPEFEKLASYYSTADICEFDNETVHRYIRGMAIGENEEKTVWHTIHSIAKDAINHTLFNSTFRPSDEDLGRFNNNLD